MYKFKCPTCGRRCKLNKKLSELRGREEKDRVYYWECDGQSPQVPHPPTDYKVQSLSIKTDGFGRIISKADKVTRLWIEDSDIHDLLDQWKQWMAEQRYARLPQKVTSESKNSD